ncbi:MAG: benzoyl-CoA reductase subunit D [Pseudomonadota bacterium]|nr:MAG: benzoyl-CoA reductase subunit D [Pseudomonadota bacterium]
MFYTVGIDVGCDSIKTALFSFDDDGSNEKLVFKDLDKIRKRNVKDVVRTAFERVLARNDLGEDDIAYIATTGEGEMVDFRRGHFFSMTAHARGAIFLDPEVRAVVDCGALHGKAMLVDANSKVISYRMTSQCASGSGQFLENIARYLGVALDDIGKISLTGDTPEQVSGICAVLAETDVINMVSRGITTANILRGVHLSMAKRLVSLMRMAKAGGEVLITGGLARNPGFIAAMQEMADKDRRLNATIRTHPDSVLAGAIGAALWAGFRHVQLENEEHTAAA